MTRETILEEQMRKVQADIAALRTHVKTGTGLTELPYYTPPAGKRLYTMQAAGSLSTLADATVYYLGAAVWQATNNFPLIVPIDGTIIRAALVVNATTAGSNEAWSMYIQKNGTSDTLISAVSVSANQRTWLNNSLNLPVSYGDTLAIKTTTPTWVTNPATARAYCILLVEV